jgi:uncharacterized alkaline shock family protein YloU
VEIPDYKERDSESESGDSSSQDDIENVLKQIDQKVAFKINEEMSAASLNNQAVNVDVVDLELGSESKQKETT